MFCKLLQLVIEKLLDITKRCCIFLLNLVGTNRNTINSPVYLLNTALNAISHCDLYTLCQSHFDTPHFRGLWH